MDKKKSFPSESCFRRFWILVEDTWVLYDTDKIKSGTFSRSFLHVENQEWSLCPYSLPIMGLLSSRSVFLPPRCSCTPSGLDDYYLDIALRVTANVHKGRWTRTWGEGSQQVCVCLGQEPGADLPWAGNVPAMTPLWLGAALGSRPCGFRRIRFVPQWISKIFH